MAIRAIPKKSINAVEIIVEADDALDLENSDYEEYRKTGDITHLKFIPDAQPTVFLCNFTLKGREAEYIKNSMIGGKDEDGTPKVALGSWQHRVVKYCLKDIRQPETLTVEDRIKFKKDKDGYVHEDTIADLEQLGITSEIFAVYSILVLGSHKTAAKN